MRRKSRNILAILLAASMMSSMCSIPAAGANFSSEEILATEDMQTEEPDQEVEESLESEDLESNPEEFLAEDPEVQPEEEPTDIEEEITSQTGEEQTPVNIGDGEEEDLFSAGDSEETSYNIWVGDIQVTDANKADVLGDLDGDARTVTFDATQKKLTLDNATITGELRLLESSDITLELKNQNKIVPYSDGRVMEDYILIRDTSTENSMKTCTITGGGSLSITDLEGVDFIESYQKLIIDGVKFNFTMAEDYDGYAVGIRSTKSVDIRNQSNITIKTNKSGGEAIVIISARPISLDNSVAVQEAGEPVLGELHVSDSELHLQSTYKSITTDGGAVTIQNSSGDLQGGIAVYGRGGISTEKSTLDITDAVCALETMGKINITNGSDIRTKSCSSQIVGYGIDITNSRVETVPDVEMGYSLDSFGTINIMNSVVIAETIMEKDSIVAFDKEMREKKTINIVNSWVDSLGGLDGITAILDSVLFIGQRGDVYGKAEIPDNTQVYPEHTLYVEEPATLTAPSGLAITNNGAIKAYCTSIRGTVKNTAPVYSHAKLTTWAHNKTSHWKECSRCKAKFESEKHKFSSWKTVKKAGWCWSGKRQHTCSVCSYTQNETIPGIAVMELVVKGGKNRVTLNWKKVSGADGYMIYGAKCGTKMKYKKTVSNKTLTWTEKKLQAGIYYKYYVVAYKTVNGKKTMIGKSKDMHTATLGKGYGYAKQITVKKSEITLKKGATATIKSTLVNTNDKVKDHMQRVRYISTNQDVATVNANGKIKAVGKGTCQIFCYGLNGFTKKVKVTVK